MLSQLFRGDFGVGYARLSTADPMGGQMQVSLWYPTTVPDSVVSLGPYEFPGTQDAEPAAGQFGLVILSHGSGGSDLGHWDTAIALAKAGFIAMSKTMPGSVIPGLLRFQYSSASQRDIAISESLRA